MTGAKIIPFPIRPAATLFEPMNVSFPHTDEEWANSVLPHLRDAIAVVRVDGDELKTLLERMRGENPEIVIDLVADWKATVEHLLNVIEVIVEAADRPEIVLKALPRLSPASA